MSHNLYNYGSQDTVYFKITLSGVGQTGLTFQDVDIKLYQDGTGVDNIGLECNNEVGMGIYYWQPTAGTQTDCEVMQINIKDDDGAAFDENCLIISTGGNANARFSG